MNEQARVIFQIIPLVPDLLEFPLVRGGSKTSFEQSRVVGGNEVVNSSNQARDREAFFVSFGFVEV
jgi:hypothetical protein